MPKSNDQNTSESAQVDGMELSEFIESALVDIIVGVNSAKQRVRNIAAIMPAKFKGESMNGVREVNFEVAVIASKKAAKSSETNTNSKAQAAFGIFAIGGSLNSGGKTGLEGTNEKVSKISFSIPINFVGHHRNDKQKTWEDEEIALNEIKGVKEKLP